MKTLSALAVLAVLLCGAPADASMLDAIRQHGFIRCGVSTGVAGFSRQNEAGVWVGFDVDYCRALAAAVLGSADKVRYFPSKITQGLEALAAGEVDVLSRTVTLTLSRAAGLGLHPVDVNFFDGQGFMIRRTASIRTLHQLQGHAICFQSGTTAGDNLNEYFNARHIAYKPVGYPDFKEMITAFANGSCDAMSADTSSLASVRVTALPQPDSYVILRQRISKEPFGPMVRQGDDQWLEIARWTLMAMIEAEELGATRATVEHLRASDNPRLRRLLGRIPGSGTALGLDDDWAYRIVAGVGNYGEVFEANLGTGSPLRLDRGLNELWTRGGLLFAYPLR
ncbi:MAG: amino acid ABC transporter substrate-binding protein [Rhodospirillaceae bacterium]